MRSNEITVLKAVAVKLDDDVVMIHTERYHTEPYDKSSIMPRDRSKHTYQWLARVAKISDIKKEIADLMSDEHAIDDYRWPNDPGWNENIVLNKSTTNKAAAKWLETRLKKMIDWDTCMKIFDGWKPGGKYANTYRPNATYDTEEFVASDGTIVSLRDKGTLLKHVGQNLFKRMIMKSQLGKTK